MKIMVIDDDPKTLADTVSCLQEVYVADEILDFTYAPFAIKYFVNCPVDMAFIKFQMKAADAFWLLGTIRKYCGDIPAYFITETALDREFSISSGAIKKGASGV